MSNTVLEHTVPSEKNIESFLRGEGSLEFKSAFSIDIDNARVVTRQTNDDGEGGEQQFLAIRGVATTAETDDNGVEVVGDALRSMPDDFSRRTTVLFNHDFHMPIGRLIPGESTRFVGGKNTRVVVDPVLIDVDARLQTGQRVVDAIERGTLNKFSFAWSTRDGIVVFTRDFFATATDEELESLGLDPEEDVAGSFRIGSENAPRIRVFSLTAVELSVVSVPADSGAGFGMANFSRNFERAFSRYQKSQGGQIHVPNNFRRDENGEIVVPIVGGGISPGLLSKTVERREEKSPYEGIGTIDRPWDAASARSRLESFDFVFESPMETLDVVDGKLVSNINGLRAATRDFDGNEQVREHLFRLYTEVHGVDPEDVPVALRQCEQNTPKKEVNQERE